jgi:hypothetical protein
MSLIPFMTDFGSFKIALRSIRPPLPNRLAIKQARGGPACLLAYPLDRKYIYIIFIET